MDGWHLGRLEWCFQYKASKGLLLSDPGLENLKPKILGSLRGPISSSLQTSNQLEAIRRLMEQLQSAEFAAGAFDAQMLLGYDLDRVIQAGRSLFTKLVPITGEYDPAERAIQRIADIPKRYYTGLSQYMSAKSEVKLSESSINIQRMSLGPAGAAYIKSTNHLTLEKMNLSVSGQLRPYFEAAMKKIRTGSRSNPIKNPHDLARSLYTRCGNGISWITSLTVK